MAFTVKTMTVAKTDPRKTFFAYAFYSDDLQGCEEILAAHATKPYYIERVQMFVDFDGYVSFGDGEDTNAVETIAMYFGGTATGVVHDIPLLRPIKLTAAKGIFVDGSAAGVVTGVVEGFTIN